MARWSGCAPADVWAALQEELAKWGLPLPQAVVFTGRGLQVVWALGDLPVAALPRWRSVQRHLGGVLLTLGADRGALDACRILRLPGTINSRSGLAAAFLHVDLDGVTEFEHLATAVLPVDRRVLRARRQDRAAPTIRVSAKARQRASDWITTILADIRTLIAYRWNGRVPEGSRNMMLFVYGTFLARVTGVSGLADALRTFAARVCDLDAAEVDQIVGSITRKLEEDGRGYRFTVVNAAAALATPPKRSGWRASAACGLRTRSSMPP